VVAEGVETAGQLARLLEDGCDLGQGYYLGPPSFDGAVLLLDRGAS
jgi:EAL domain-containing protein (putative c-di-GMP-specific phosphodiesterase class I)